MQFLFGDRELVLSPGDLMQASVDVIVNSADCDLSCDAGIGATLLEHGGDQIAHECRLLIKQYEQIDAGMAVYTTAGNLPHKAMIHAVGPRIGEGSEQQKIEQLVARCLHLCEINEWQSIAFPAISTGLSGVSVETCAQGFFRSITHFWDARHECAVEKIEICLTDRNLMAFFNAFREDAIINDVDKEPPKTDEDEAKTGYIELNENDVMGDDEINDWFK